MRRRTMRVAVVVPAFNEAAVIGRVVRGAEGVRGIGMVIVVDDGSSDATALRARRAGARVIRHSHNRGVGAALRTGFSCAERWGADAVVVMGGDAQDRAEEIPRLLGRIVRGDVFVQGSRWLPGGRVVGMPVGRRAGTRLYSWLFSMLAGRRVTDGTNGFRAFLVDWMKTLRLNQGWLDSYELEPYMYYEALRSGRPVSEVPVTKMYPRATGFTKMKPVRDWWRIARPLLLLWTGLRS